MFLRLWLLRLAIVYPLRRQGSTPLPDNGAINVLSLRIATAPVKTLLVNSFNASHRPQRAHLLSSLFIVSQEDLKLPTVANGLADLSICLPIAPSKLSLQPTGFRLPATADLKLLFV